MPFEAHYSAKVFKDRPRIVVAASPNVAPGQITDALNDVSKNFSGSSVEPAAVAKLPIDGKHAFGYVDSVVGTITFQGTMSDKQFKKALDEIKKALVNRNIDESP